ncbi:PTS sugar transporter subunit IIB [Thorsellia anophelis]|uniref:PTS system, cellobiose-specific IIB component n=1 Tax=Thorsellia anophelis DSM 18579 TaxID=1123402 RepID=A0A1I0F6X8_9GAMM|nr:PTS sugar transporter subunit IIB [Thorsellia anophelis]SET53722.1 PTS system, cellobiose-specific IIB component [Thorsellia anophelis DSM 18579]
MKHIYLFCSAGMSTNMLVTKMKLAAKEQHLTIHICAFSESLISTKAEDADIILLGPQIRYLLDDISHNYPNKPIAVIDASIYAKLDGKALLESALAKIDEINVMTKN